MKELGNAQHTLTKVLPNSVQACCLFCILTGIEYEQLTTLTRTRTETRTCETAISTSYTRSITKLTTELN